jgi:uncharacterized membrane protein
LQQSVMPFFGHFTVARAILGFLLVFLLPGFAWSLVFFKKITFLERAAFSFGLSIALVSLAVFSLNVLLRVPISGTNALIAIAVLTVIPTGIYFIKKYPGQKSRVTEGE